jgi:TatD DNase family protein
MDKVIPDLDLSHVVLETDSPYLSPVPHRGKRNEPAYLALIAQRIADLREMGLNELIEITTTNANNLFKVAQ